MREINTEDKRNQGQRSSQNQSDGDKFSKETIKRKRKRRSVHSTCVCLNHLL